MQLSEMHGTLTIEYRENAVLLCVLAILFEQQENQEIPIQLSIPQQVLDMSFFNR